MVLPVPGGSPEECRRNVATQLHRLPLAVVELFVKEDAVRGRESAGRLLAEQRHRRVDVEGLGLQQGLQGDQELLVK